MFSSLFTAAKEVLHAARDSALGASSAWIANTFKLHRIGKMTSFRIDSDKQQIFATLDLHGEVTPVDLAIDYRIVEEPGGTMLEVVRLEASREWITTLVNEMIPADKKRIPVPALLKIALSRVVK